MNRFIPIAVAIAFWPVWRWYVLRMTDGSDEPWGIVALVAAGVLLWMVRGEIKMTTGGMVAAGVILICYLVGFGLMPPLIRAMLAILCIAALTGTLTRHPAIWGVFVLSLPIIASMQFYLGFPLRMFTAQLAVGGLNLFGSGVTREGTQLFWDGQVVGIDAPCSGVKMLWTGMFVVLCSCGLLRLGWLKTTIASVAALLLIIFGNALRATLLVVKESGMVSLPDWTHEGIGVVIFAALIFAVTRYLKRADRSQEERPGRARSGNFAAAASLASLALLAAAAAAPFYHASSAKAETAEFPGWPVQWEGHVLEALPMTAAERAFADQFPGEVGVFAAGPNKVIMRWVTQPTRKLHSSADCFRAAGYSIDVERSGAGCFIASADEGAFLVEQTIFEDGNSDGAWREVSAWFWSASLSRTQGPWWAVTAIRPITS
ncbi:MAG: archaeosortase/exosortase family protein [Verrucomicrobiota bacterium]